MKVNVFYRANLPKYYRATSKYKQVVLKAINKCGAPKGEINVILVSASEILKINKQFLNHNYVTDVISFSYAKHDIPSAPFGDIFICFEQAKKQAGRHGGGALLELLVLAAHGALHLAGWKDNTPKLRNIMNKKAEDIARAAA